MKTQHTLENGWLFDKAGDYAERRALDGYPSIKCWTSAHLWKPETKRGNSTILKLHSSFICAFLRLHCELEQYRLETFLNSDSTFCSEFAVKKVISCLSNFYRTKRQKWLIVIQIRCSGKSAYNWLSRYFFRIINSDFF